MAVSDDGSGPAVEQDLAWMVRWLRRRALLTQEQLAERSGVAVRTIRRLETGELLRPLASSLRLLADATGIDQRGAGSAGRGSRRDQLATVGATAGQLGAPAVATGRTESPIEDPA